MIVQGSVCFPTSFQKKMLVWVKFYPNIEAVPQEVR